MTDIKTLSLLLPIIFILHNMEEYLYYGKFSQFYSRFIEKKFNDPIIFLYAISFLSFIVFIVIGSNYLFKNEMLNYLMIIVFLSILMNSIQHCVSSLYFRNLLPGTFTSITLIIPYSIFFLITLNEEYQLQIKWGVFFTLTSLISAHLLIFVSFRVGYWIKLKFQQQ